jgi:uncharacterized membrane protein YfcA
MQKNHMDISMIIGLLLIGFAAGILGGMVGVGGGLIVVPALVFFFGFSQHQAQGTSLGLLVLPVALLGMMNYYKAGYVDFKVVGLLALSFFVGSGTGPLIVIPDFCAISFTESQILFNMSMSILFSFILTFAIQGLLKIPLKTFL